MIRFLTVCDIIAIHDSEKQCALLNRGALESAAATPETTWDGKYLYPTLLDKAAALLFSVCKAHAFEDANKRTAWLSCVIFLDLNGVNLAGISQREVTDFMMKIAAGDYSIAQIKERLALLATKR